MKSILCNENCLTVAIKVKYNVNYAKYLHLDFIVVVEMNIMGSKYQNVIMSTYMYLPTYDLAEIFLKNGGQDNNVVHIFNVLNNELMSKRLTSD